jgi:hypothetical protein
MNPKRIPARLLCAALLAAATAAGAQQQTSEVQARQRYEREVAACNSGTLAAPAREACIRAAGNALDRALGGPPPGVAVPSADGRATIVTPAGAPPPSSGSDAVPSSDGRATIVLPADRTAPR